jgi:large subunit ribosomal protein L10
LSAEADIFNFMAKTKEQKVKIVEDLKEKIAKAKAMFFVDYKGLKVKDLSDLRKKLKEKGGKFLVAKKTLMGLVFKEKKIKVPTEEMEGQIALVFGFEDELSPAKAVYQFSQQNNNLKILGGFIESQKGDFLSSEEIITLGQLPSREELLAKTVGSISAPMSNFVNILQGNIKGLIYALSAIK